MSIYIRSKRLRPTKSKGNDAKDKMFDTFSMDSADQGHKETIENNIVARFSEIFIWIWAPGGA